MDLIHLSKVMHDPSTYDTFAVYNHLLLDTRVPKSVCSEDWLQRLNWYPANKIPLPESTGPIRFAGQNVKHLYVA